MESEERGWVQAASFLSHNVPYAVRARALHQTPPNHF